MKKICFFSGDITRSGGTERVATMIANELAAQETYDIIFLSLCEQKETPFFKLDKRIRRYTLGEKWIQPGPGYLPLILKLKRFLKEQDIDIIIDIDIVLDVLSIPATKKLRTKVISWEHFNVYFEMSVLYRKLILKYSVKHSDYVITLTEGDKRNYEQILKRKEKIEAIYNPMEEAVDLKDEKRKNQILWVGRLVDEKGVEYLAEVAVKILKEHKDWQWYVLGEGEKRGFLEKVIAKNQLEKQLILTGLVSNVGEYLGHSKLFVLTSKTEGLGMCLLEAKTYNLPCVSFDVPMGPNEIIADEKNGFLIKPFDCEEMIHKINLLIENEKLLQDFSDHAHVGIEKFQKKSIMQKWNRVLENLCD